MLNFLGHFLINNWLTLSVLIGLILIAVRHQNMNKRTAILFICAASCCLLSTIFSGIDIYLGRNEFVTLNPLRVVGSLFAYALKPFASIFVLNFILKVDSKKQRWVFGITTIPAAINFIICMLSFALGEQLVCYFSSDNHWHGGTLSFFPVVIGYIYLAAIAGVVIYRSLKHDFEEFFVVLFMVFIVIIACIMEDYVGGNDIIIYEASLINGTTAIGLTFIYFHLYISKNKIDELTGLHNRGSYYFDIKKYKGRVSAIISIDMNNLKETNDTYGHAIGDLALATIGKIIKTNSKNNKTYRIGGDEFLVVCFKTKEDEVQNMIANIRQQVIDSGYTVAIGYCMAGEGNVISVENALRLADDRMYKDKYEIKSKLIKYEDSKTK